MAQWTTAEALELCREVEAIAPHFGAHVALTGGLLYKDGPRKDCDLLFYCIRQQDEIEEDELLAALSTAGFTIINQFGWVVKAKWQGKDVDLFFPEAHPASSLQINTGTY